MSSVDVLCLDGSFRELHYDTRKLTEAYNTEQKGVPKPRRLASSIQTSITASPAT